MIQTPLRPTRGSMLKGQLSITIQQTVTNYLNLFLDGLFKIKRELKELTFKDCTFENNNGYYANDIYLFDD